MATRQQGSKKQLIKTLGVFAVGLVAAIGAIFVGRADQGQIDVSATIARSNAEDASNGVVKEGAPQPVPAQFANVPNGGLVPQGGGSDQSPAQNGSPETPAETATTTATGTEASSEDTTQDSTASGAEGDAVSEENGQSESVGQESQNGAGQ